MAEFVDPYLDPDTGVLLNRVGAATWPELGVAESDLSTARLTTFVPAASQSTGDLAELCAIHRWLFGDVYDWAGRVRTVDIRKSADGSSFFLPVSLIVRAAAFVSRELHDDDMLRGMGRDQFVERLAYHYDQLNYVHPFREGNGRTQRVFWNRVALEAGWELDWSGVAGETNDEACRVAADEFDLAPLLAMFDQVVHPATPPGERDSRWRAGQAARLLYK